MMNTERRFNPDFKRWISSYLERTYPYPPDTDTKGQRIMVATNLHDRLKDIEANPPDISGFKMSRLKYMVHLVISHRQKKRPDAYACLHMPYLRNVVPYAEKYMRFLRDEGILHWQNHSKGNHSRLYQLNMPSKIAFRTLTDQALIRRINKTRTTMKKRNSKKYPELNKWIQQVELNYSDALQTIKHEFNTAEDRVTAIGRRLYSLASIERIRDGDIYISVNDTNGRLDTNFTNMPSSLVQHLHINSNKFVELDITNSQPFFVIALLRPTPEARQVIDKYDPEILEYIDTAKPYRFKDAKRYAKLVARGQFYEYMEHCIRKTGVTVSSRKEIKQETFRILFGKWQAYIYDDAVNVFRHKFPTVYKLFTAIKYDAYNRLAILLQRIEAHAMLEVVAQDVLAAKPTVPFITRHDSILPVQQAPLKMLTTDVCETDIDLVQKMMIDGVKKVVGIKPKSTRSKFT